MSATAYATTYYVSKDDGDDSYDGLAQTHEYGSHGPWRSVWRAMWAGDWNAYYYPGSAILFKRGNEWNDGNAFLVYGHGVFGTPNLIGAYGSGANPRIVGTNDRQGGTQGIWMTEPDYWIIDSIDFYNEYRGIEVLLNTTGHQSLTIQNCNFETPDAWVLTTPSNDWPTPAATGIVIEGTGSGVGSGADILTGLYIDNCHFKKMGQSIAVGNIGHNGNEGLVKHTVISNCVMEDGSFIQLAAVGAHDFQVLHTKIWNNGVNIQNGPANFVFYGALYRQASTDLVVEDSEIGFARRDGSPIDGDGMELDGVDSARFTRVLFHHNAEVAIVVNYGDIHGVHFEDCVFAADEVDDVPNVTCERYGEIRLHWALYGSFTGCRFLPRDGLPDIPELSGQDHCSGGWHSAPASSDITYSNTTTSEYGKEILGPNLATGASWSYQYTDESGYATWLYTFTAQTTINTVKLTETDPGAISKFVVQYWDGATWRDAYTGKGVGTSKYDNYVPFPARTTTFLRVQRLEPNAPLGLSAFEVYNATGATDPTDQFLSTTLDQNWSWVRPYGNWNLYNRLGFLRIMTDGHDLWQSGGGVQSILLRTMPGGDRTAATRLSFNAALNYQQAGLILYTGDDDYLKLVYGHDDNMGGMSVEFALEKNAVFDPKNKIPVNSDPIDLRIRKIGSTYIGEYSTDYGATWQYVGQFDAAPTFEKVGLIAQSTQGALADFDWFDIR